MYFLLTGFNFLGVYNIPNSFSVCNMSQFVTIFGPYPLISFSIFLWQFCLFKILWAPFYLVGFTNYFLWILFTSLGLYTDHWAIFTCNFFCTSFDYITFFRSDRLLSVSLFHEHKACVITLLPTLKRFHSKFVVFINCCAIGSQAKLVRAHPKEFINKKRQSPSWKKEGVKMKR